MFVFRLVPVLYLFVLVGCASGTGGLPIPTEPLEVPAVENPSAQDYYGYGERILEERPSTAAKAFYWAARRDPTWASPLFARRLALFLDNNYLYAKYLEGSASALESPAVRQLDSLYLKALKLNPFLDRRLDSRALRALWKESVRQAIRQQYPMAHVTDFDLETAVNEYILGADQEFRAWLAHSEGRYGEAVDAYSRAIEGEDDAAELHADMARALFMIGRYGEAVDHMQAAIAELRDEDEDELQRVYSSKALYLHCIGLVEETRGRTADARDAYAEALQEDLSYHPAHVRLAELALAEADTVTALNEMRLAAEISPDEAAVLLSYGRLLEATGDLAGAGATFRHLTEIEPHFALPFERLAAVLDAEGSAADAAVAYRAFIERAPRDAAGLPSARARLAELEASLPEPADAADLGATEGGSRDR